MVPPSLMKDTPSDAAGSGNNGITQILRHICAAESAVSRHVHFSPTITSSGPMWLIRARREPRDRGAEEGSGADRPSSGA